MTDPYGPSRKLSAIESQQLQAFGEALIDRVTAISGNQQLNIIEAVEKSVAALRSEYDARQRNDLIVLEYLKRSDSKLDVAISGVEEANGRLGKLEESHAALTEQVSALGGTVSTIGEELDTVKTVQAEHGARIGKVEERVVRLETKVDTLAVELRAVKMITEANQRILEAIAPPEDIQRIMDTRGES